MKKKCLIFSILTPIILLASILIPTGLVFAASPSVDDVKVFQGYEETGDWLITVVYNISGTANTSYCDIYSYSWRIQLLDGATVKAENTISQCGMRPASIYLSADMASSLEWGKNYSVKIYGNWGSTPNASRTINTSDWLGTNLVYLDQWVIKEAKIMQTYDVTTYVDTVAVYGDVLNVDGGYLFDTGIPYLSSYRPNIFEITIENIPVDYNASTYAGTYGEDLYNDWDTNLGVPISTALTNAGYYFGINGRLMGALLTLIGFICLACVSSKSIAFMIILGGVVVGLIPMALIYVLVFILVIIFIRAFFWSST